MDACHGSESPRNEIRDPRSDSGAVADSTGSLDPGAAAHACRRLPVATHFPFLFTRFEFHCSSFDAGQLGFAGWDDAFVDAFPRGAGFAGAGGRR